MINFFDHKIPNLILNTKELKLKNSTFTSNLLRNENINYGNLSPFLTHHKFSGNLDNLNIFLENLVYFPSKNFQSSFKSTKKIKNFVTIKIFDFSLEKKNLNPIIIIKPIIVNIKKKSLKISSSYYNDEYYNNNIKNRIIKIKNNNITKFFSQNNVIDNQENRNSTKKSRDNRREIDENNKIIEMSDKIGRKRGREEEKDKSITKYDIGSFYLYEDTIAYISGLKVVFHDNESSSYLMLDQRYQNILFISLLEISFILFYFISFHYLLHFFFFLKTYFFLFYFQSLQYYFFCLLFIYF